MVLRAHDNEGSMDGNQTKNTRIWVGMSKQKKYLNNYNIHLYNGF